MKNAELISERCQKIIHTSVNQHACAYQKTGTSFQRYALSTARAAHRFTCDAAIFVRRFLAKRIYVCIHAATTPLTQLLVALSQHDSHLRVSMEMLQISTNSERRMLYTIHSMGLVSLFVAYLTVMKHTSRKKKNLIPPLRTRQLCTNLETVQDYPPNNRKRRTHPRRA